MAVTGQGSTSVIQGGNIESRGLTIQVRDQRNMKLQARGPPLLPRVVTLLSPGDSTVQVRDLGLEPGNK